MPGLSGMIGAMNRRFPLILSTALKTICAATLVAVSTEAVQAAAFMLDFGPTSVGTATTLSPYHAVNPSFTDTVWNSSLGTADVSSGLLYSDNSPATGVTINLGTGSGTTSILTTAPGSSSALGTGINTGIYGGSTSVARDAIFNSFTSISMQISGLAAGTYDIYYVGRNTNRGLTDNYTQSIFAGSSASAGNFNWSGYNTSMITYGGANTNTSSWVLGQNYAKATVTLGTGNMLNLGFSGTGIETRGFVNALQVVAVPEPSVSLLLAAGLFVYILAARRRSRPILSWPAEKSDKLLPIQSQQ